MIIHRPLCIQKSRRIIKMLPTLSQPASNPTAVTSPPRSPPSLSLPGPSTSGAPRPSARRDEAAALGARWRARLVERCLSYSQEQREALVCDSRRRKAVLRELRAEANGLGPDGAGLEGGVARVDVGGDVEMGLAALEGGEDLERLVAELEAAVEAERRAEDEAYLVAAAESLYLSSQADDDADVAELTAFAGSLSLGGAEDGFVLCPVCERAGLVVRHGAVFCSCGMRVNGGDTDNVTLDMVRARLEEVFAAHAKDGCTAKPTFGQDDVLGLGFTFLHVKCGDCGLASIAF
jgi:Replication protein A interacting C-terminal